MSKEGNEEIEEWLKNIKREISKAETPDLETIRGQLATVKNQYKQDVIFNNSEIKYAVSMLGIGVWGEKKWGEREMWSVSNYCGYQGQQGWLSPSQCMALCLSLTAAPSLLSPEHDRHF